MKTRRAFTLIELLTVIAISAILMTLIVVPIFQSFNLTRTAQAFADAQEKGRILTERIAREINGAVSVRGSNERVDSTLNGANVRLATQSLVIALPGRDSAYTEIALSYVKMDLIKPAEGDIDSSLAPGVFRDPVSGRIDPTLKGPKGQVNLPVGPGQTMVRFFVGLRDPFSDYNNPYDGLLMARGGGRDNLYVLYRAEVPIRVRRLVKLTGGATTTVLVANPYYFDVDPASVVGTDVLSGVNVGTQPLLDDPRFFLPNRTAAGKVIDTDLRAERIRYWQGRGLGDNTTTASTVLLGPSNNPSGDAGLYKVELNDSARTLVLTEVSRYDMIQPIFDKNTRKVSYVGNLPRIVPMVQFRPTRVSNDPAEGHVAVRLGEESVNAGAIAPDVFTTQLGLLTNTVVRAWPTGWDANNAAANEYLVGRYDPNAGVAGNPPGFSIYAVDPNVTIDDFTGGTEVFDLDTYNKSISLGLSYPFSQGVNAANVRSGWLSDPKLRSIFTPFTLDTGKGKILASFSVSEVGDASKPIDPLNRNNLPTLLTNPAGAVFSYTPSDDPNLGNPLFTGAGLDPAYSSVNSQFNKVFTMWQSDTTGVAGLRDLDQSHIQRHIDLRVSPQGDGSTGPLAPGLFGKVRIVPGSDQVYGPDQNPGLNAGLPVRYVRTTRRPGPNEYKINYTDIAEPTNAAGNIDYTQLGLKSPVTDGFNANVYDPTNFVGVFIQPQFKAGYIQLDSDPTAALPLGQIKVSYRFQFTTTRTGTDAKKAGSKTDVFAVDYDSRQLMSVLLTMRNYPQSNVPNPQTVTLKATATVRNYTR